MLSHTWLNPLFRAAINYKWHEFEGKNFRRKKYAHQFIDSIFLDPPEAPPYCSFSTRTAFSPITRS